MQPKRRTRPLLRRLLAMLIGIVVSWYLLCCLAMLAMRWINPPFTMVHAERRLEAVFVRKPYTKQYRFVPARQISGDLRHAVVAAEDTRFYDHHGFDWVEVQKAMGEESNHSRGPRGASTITQQLVKNLFLTTDRSLIRKGLEAILVPPAELLLSKDRILELYLNVVEWGPGVYGAEAASRYHYKIPASKVGREQAARLAACLPNPLVRRPARTGEYASEVLERMWQMGW
jgi:monofunctional biosynthetic peptidoglycan transglycosylase